MALCRHQFRVTYRTILCSRTSSCRTGSVTLCRCQFYITYRAILRGCTGCRRTRSVRDRIHIIAFILITATTGIRRISLLRTSRRGYGRAIAVPQSCRQLRATYRTVLCGRTSSRRTGSMTLCRYQLRVAYRAMLCSRTGCLRAGSMRERICQYDVAYRAVLRRRTGCRRAGGMTFCRRQFYLTYRAILRSRTGCLRAGGMRDHWHGFLFNENFVAKIAMRALGQTG